MADVAEACTTQQLDGTLVVQPQSSGRKSAGGEQGRALSAGPCSAGGTAGTAASQLHGPDSQKCQHHLHY